MKAEEIVSLKIRSVIFQRSRRESPAVSLHYKRRGFMQAERREYARTEVVFLEHDGIGVRFKRLHPDSDRLLATYRHERLKT